MTSGTRRSILIINPNSTQSMTESLALLVKLVGHETTQFSYFTAPSGVQSINDENDAAVSAEHCLPTLKPQIPQHDAFLICCYSQHPLVPMIRSELAALGLRKPVTGIFEASIAACLRAIDINPKFGIVSTGAQWDGILSEAVAQLLGTEHSSRYAGTETTGLNATELHSTSADEVAQRMKAATRRVLSKGARAICLGCAGMAGMDRIVRTACVEELGEDIGNGVKIVDGVVCGVAYLEGALRAGL